MIEGRVLKSYNGYYYVQAEDKIITCKIKGKMKQNRFTLCTGDKVRFEMSSLDEGMITEVLPRKNLIHRPTIANIDLLAVTLSVVNPDFSYLIMDKLLTMAAYENIDTIIVITKIDLADNVKAEEIKKLYESIGYEVYLVSPVTGEGIEELVERMKGKVVAFGGPSGVGKSTTLNAIQPDNIRVTGDVSEKIGRGKHTTRYAELTPFYDGYLADTPGFGNVGLEMLDEKRISECFREFKLYESQCKYSPCTHIHEPICGVRDALETGKIAKSRYDSYISILKEIKEEKERNYRK